MNSNSIFSESATFRTILGDYSIESSSKNVPINGITEDESTVVGEQIGSKKQKFLDKLSESYEKFNEFTDGRIIDVDTIKSEVINLPNVFQDTLSGQLESRKDSSISSLTLRNVYENSDFDFFRNLDNFSVNTIANQTQSLL